MHNHFVYIYYDENNVPFYVGMGKGHRHLDHLKYAKNAITYRAARNKLSHKLNKIIQMLEQGLEPTIVLASENLSSEAAKILEIQYIKSFGRRDLGTGTLTNLTNGGEGVVGRTTMVSPDGGLVSILKEDKLAFEEQGYVHFNKNRKHSLETNKKKANPWKEGRAVEHSAKIKLAAERGAYKERNSRGPHSECTLAKMRAPKVKRDGYQGRHWYHSKLLQAEVCINIAPLWGDVQKGRLPKSPS